MYNSLKLKELISKRRLTYEEIAEKTGLSKTTVYLVVNEKQEIKISVLEKIAAALDAPITYFFSEVDDEVEKLQELVKLLTDKTTLLEIQLAQFQNEAEIAEMKLKALINIGQLYQAGQTVEFEQKVNELITLNERLEGYNINKDNIENPKTQLKTMINDLTKKIAIQKLLTLKLT